MLWVVTVILTLLWLLGMVTGYTMGGFIYLLPAIALIMVLASIVHRRRLT
jgi:hypothetical protein